MAATSRPSVLEVNQAGQIKPLNLTETPREVFTFLDVLDAEADSVDGNNAASRGEAMAGD